MLTVREVLAIEVIERAQPEVLAGADNLDRLVRWVHVFDVGDIAHLLLGQELLFTTGLGLGNNSASLRRLIRDVSEVGAAGLVIELGRTFDSISEDCIREAENLHFPLVVLRKEVRYVEVTEEVHAAIINRQVEVLKKADAIGREFTGLMLRGASVEAIVARLAEFSGSPVVLEDTAHQVVDWAHPSGGDLTAVLDTWGSHARTQHARDEGGRELAIPDSFACAWAGIWLRSEEWGRLHTLEVDRRLDEVDLAAVDRAAAAIGTALLVERNARNLTDHARGSILVDVIAGRAMTAVTFYRRARNLGAYLEGRELSAIVLGTSRLEQLPTSEIPVGESERQHLRDSLLEAARLAVNDVSIPCLFALHGDRVFAVAGTAPGQPMKSLLTDFAERARDRAGKDPGLGDVSVGVSHATSVASLSKAFEQAIEALDFAFRNHDWGVHHYSDLGSYPLLVRLSEGPELARFVESELGPLLAYDAHSNAPLIPTLSCYLRCGSNKSTAAKLLYIDRRSLYHRLERIETILGRDLNDSEVAFNLTLAVQAMEVLNSRKFRLRETQ